MGSEFQISASAGYARFPRDGQKVEDVMRAANIALLHAKKNKGSAAVEFKPYMNSARQERQKIEARLRAALTADEFVLNYQPQYCANGMELYGFEALLRLSDEDGRPISPADFIPIAEEIGLIGEIGEWVLRTAAREASTWPEEMIVSVNLSPAQFQTHNIPSLVNKVLGETGLPAGRLELEVTESLLIEDSHEVFTTFKKLKKIGTLLALDDFGTGYSSLNYLWRFPFDKLKVDKAFVDDISAGGGKSREILAAIIALGRTLGLRVTVEGVETEEQAEVLRDLKCDVIQGYLYSKPLNTRDVNALLGLRAEMSVDKSTPAGSPSREIVRFPKKAS